MRATASSVSFSLHGFAQELAAFWPSYLLHHRQPLTRRLHQVGSWSCIAGLVAALVVAWWWLPVGIVAGYGFAFAGHWAVERNRPLTFDRPFLAGLCNWRMFWLELTGDIEHALAQATLLHGSVAPYDGCS
jgi:hypothetical protein